MHFVIKLLCHILYYEICQKSSRKWVVTPCNKIITSIYLPIYLDHISTSTWLVATIFGRLMSSDEESPPTKSHNPLITWSGDHVTNGKRYIFTSTRVKAVNLDKEVAFDEKILPRKSRNSLSTWSHEVTWLIKNVISPFPQDLWSPNLTGWWLMIRSNKLESRISFQSRG